MSVSRILAAACAALLAGLAGASPASAFEVRASSGLPVVASPSGVPIAVSVPGPARAQAIYVVPVVPRVLGVRDAPVGQPVIYVIDGPEASDGADAPRVRRLER